MAFYTQKNWWASKSIWTGIIGSAFAIAAAFGFVPAGLDPEMVTTAVLGVVGVLTVVFRVTATEAVSLTPVAPAA